MAVPRDRLVTVGAVARATTRVQRAGTTVESVPWERGDGGLGPPRTVRTPARASDQ